MSAADVTAARPRRSRSGSSLVSTVVRAWRYPQMKAGVMIAGAVILIALLGPLFAPHTPSEFVTRPFSGPSSDALLGTDYVGQDVLSRTLWGGRSVLWMSLAAALIGVGCGVFLGLIAGYSDGRSDSLIMRGLDVVLAFPQLVLVLLFVSLLGPKLWLIVLLTAVAWAPGVARVTRGITLEVAQRDFVKAAEVLGVPRRSILAGEILPNLSSPLLVEFALRLTWSIALIAGLSFLGLGIQAPAADWGLMINENRNGITPQPWGVVAPIVMIALLTIGVGLIAEGIGRTMAGLDRKDIQ